MDELSEFREIFLRSADYRHYIPTGSSVICDPPTTDTDIDVVCVYNAHFSSQLQSAGFKISPHEEYPNERIKACYRKGRVNVIACDSEWIYQKWVEATELAKLLNLQHKMQRVILFQHITEGKVRDGMEAVQHEDIAF